MFALENVAQLFSVEPVARGAIGWVLTDQRLKVSQLREVQFVGVLKQRPTHAFKLRVKFLLLPTYCFERLGRVGDDVDLSKVTRAPGRCSLTPLMKAGDMSMLTEVTYSGEPPCSLRYVANHSIVLASLPLVTNTTRRACMSATSVRYS